MSEEESQQIMTVGLTNNEKTASRGASRNAGTNVHMSM